MRTKNIKSCQKKLENLKHIFEQFKNKYKEELSDKLDKAEGESKKELQNYLLKVNATGIQNLSSVLKTYYKCELSDIANYRRLAEYAKNNFTKLCIKSQIMHALEEEPNLDKIPEFHSLKQQYLDDED